ncbi:Putative RNA methylase [Phaffia rhodozyma]|uniref:tRNA (guanine(10)-N(2))-methyltransferase n=1 Tax=Phaffia rhodozyma TaxID=264483 RepID=A0A0F7SIA4_PHARH|nr:Putative RNA methylase [Phaffia rhodozyma]
MTLQLFYLTWGTTHGSFRLPELESVAKLYDINFHLPPFSPNVIEKYNAQGCGLDEEWDIEGRAILVLGLEKVEDAFKLGERGVGIRSLHKLYALAPTLATLHTVLSQLPRTKEARPWDIDLEGDGSTEPKRWKFRFDSFAKMWDSQTQQEKMIAFDHLELKGKPDMKTPELEFGIFEEYLDRPSPAKPDPSATLALPEMVYYGLLTTHSTARPLLTHYSLKTRPHIGNTSMDAEISLLMANQALARNGSFVWDPFAGTGSMLLTCAHWGAFCVGSDIDGRQMRGKEKGKKRAGTPGIKLSAAKYGTQDQIVDLLTFDVTKNPWRVGRMFDAIVTDPPYGVRAGAKRLGRKDPSKLRNEPYFFPEGHPDAGKASYELPEYLPPFRPYQISHLAMDLVRLARYALKPGGRLVFFLPVVNDEYESVDVPTIEGMKLISNSVEDFGKWARRLITLELNINAPAVDAPRFDSESFFGTPSTSKEEAPGDDSAPSEQRLPGHHNFREKFFTKVIKSASTGLGNEAKAQSEFESESVAEAVDTHST